MSNKNPSINETSDKIRKRSSELILKDKLKPDKILQDRQHKLNRKRDKKKSMWSMILTIIALLTLLFGIAVHYDWLPRIKSSDIIVEQTSKT